MSGSRLCCLSRCAPLCATPGLKQGCRRCVATAPLAPAAYLSLHRHRTDCWSVAGGGGVQAQNRPRSLRIEYTQLRWA